MKSIGKTLVAVLMTLFASVAFACSTDFNVSLETFGEGVFVELRAGTPGNSRVVRSTRTSGGTVNFANLCRGNYFMAIGNGDSVNVTPVRYFDDDAEYSSRIVLQRGSGNVSRQSRRSL